MRKSIIALFLVASLLIITIIFLANQKVKVEVSLSDDLIVLLNQLTVLLRIKS